MSFWVFMLTMDLLIPLTMIVIGSYYVNHAPKNINPFVGYRTARSMKNKETWVFAHHHMGRLWRTIGWVMLPVSLAGMLFSLGRKPDDVGTLGGLLCGAQLIVLVASVFPTERALKKTFDKSGLRKS